jgi:thymidylate kinase
MPANAAALFESFFRELTRREIPFALLHSYERMPEEIPSDIDFAVRCEDLPKLPAIQREIAAQHGWLLASVVESKIFSLTSVLFHASAPADFIQLDACGHYVEGNYFVLRDSELLEKRVPHRSFFAPAPTVEFGYVLAKTLIKERPILPYLPRLTALSETDTAGTSAMFKKLTGDTDLKNWFTRPATEWDNELRERVRLRTRLGLANRFRETLRFMRRLFHPVGLHIVILGPDGVGKSTLVSRLAEFACFRRQRLFHFRPGLLDQKESGKPVTQPHAQSLRSGMFSFLKSFYYFADHWFGYWIKIFPARVRNEFIVFDRSFADILIDPRRYRMARASSLARLLNRLLPQADLTIVLDADPEMIHARKPELTLEELARQRSALRELAKATPCSVVVSAGQSPERVEHIVRLAILTFLAEREKERRPG